MDAVKRKPVTLAFELSMPNRGSWNGGWSGDGRPYVIVRRGNESLVGYHSYSWTDGWCAAVTVRIVDSREAAKLRRKSRGFSGYDWMVDSLMIDGRIIAPSERARPNASAVAQ